MAEAEITDGSTDQESEDPHDTMEAEEDRVDWEERCHVLEMSLERFRDQALNIRNVLSHKMHELEEKASSAEKKAEDSQVKLKAMEQKLSAMNWKPRETDKRLQELVTRCEEKDRVIEHLERQLEQQHKQRLFDAQLVEEKATRIKQWVAAKLTELEDQNHDLQTENDLLHEQVDILRDRLNSLPPFAAKEIFRVSFQGSTSQVSTQPTNHLPHNASSPELGQHDPHYHNDLDYHNNEEYDRIDETIFQNNHIFTNGDFPNDNYDDPDYHSSEVSSGDVDIGDLDSVSDDSIDNIDNDTDPIYYEVDENHESKYEPTNYNPPISFHPPQVRIERKVFKDVTLMDSFISSSNGSEETLHKSACERLLSHASLTSDKLDDITSDGEIEDKNFTIHDVVEEPIIIGDNFPILIRSPRLPYVPHLPSDSPATPPFTKKSFNNHRVDNVTAIATLPRNCPDNNILRNRNIYMADDLSPMDDAEVTLLQNGYLNSDDYDDDDVEIGEHITICTNNVRPSTIDIETPPVSPVTKCSSITKCSSSQSDTNVPSVVSKSSKFSEMPMTESYTEVCTFENLYRDISIPVYASLNGRAARIRNCPFTEDSSCESSDDEPLLGATTGPITTDATPEVISPAPMTNSILVATRKPPSMPAGQASIKRVSSHSANSSDYALPPDEIQPVSDSDTNEPEHKLLKTSIDSRIKVPQETFQKSGYLSKLGGKLKTWKRCWFILHTNELVYYKSQHDILRRPKGQITLDGQTTVTKSHGELTFEVTNSKRTYYLTAETSESVDQWIKAIQHTLKRQATNLLLKNTDSKLVHKGWLNKVKNGTSHRCWCVLMSRHFVYYRQPSDKVPISQVDLQGSRIEDVDTTFDSDEEHDRPLSDKHVIAVWRQGLAPIYLVLPNQHEKDTWMYHLTVAAGGGMGNVGTEFEQLIYKLMEVNADYESVYWKHPLVLFSKDLLSKPLTTLSSQDLQNEALELFKLITRFVCTPIESPKLEQHVDMAQTILDTCLRHPELQNEFYCHLVKQTSRHPIQQKSGMQNLLLCGKQSWFLCDSSPTSPTTSFIDTSSDTKHNPPHWCLTQSWQLLSLSLALFLPKQSVMWLLRVHLQKHADPRHDIGKYAIFCQRALERTSLRGGRKARPSRMEVLSILLRHPYHHSQPISVPVHFINANYQVVSFDGSSAVSEFTHTMTKSLGMREASPSGFALYSDDPGGGDMQHYLQPHFKVCDVISKWEQVYKDNNSGKPGSNTTIKLLYKHRLCMKSSQPQESEKERLLLVYQINDDIINSRFPLNKDLAVELASLMAQIEYGDIRLGTDTPNSPTIPPRSPLLPPRSPSIPRTPITTPRSPNHAPRSPITTPRSPHEPTVSRAPMIVPRSPSTQSRSPITVPRSPTHLPRSPTSLSQQLTHIVEKFYPKHYLHSNSDDIKTVCQTIRERWTTLHGRSTHDCVRVYLTVARKWPYCGSKVMHTQLRGPTNDQVWLAVHEDGLAVLEHSTMQCVHKFDYKSVVTFGGWNTDFMIVVNQIIESAPHHYEHSTDRILFLLPKSQILEVTSLMVSYINNRTQSLQDDSHIT